jgi:hypothetical protein
MRIPGAVVLMVLLTAPAYAQMPNLNLMPEVASRTPEQKEQDAIKEKAYRESLKKIPESKGSSDPWGTVRGNDTKAAAPAKPKTGGSAANAPR